MYFILCLYVFSPRALLFIYGLAHVHALRSLWHFLPWMSFVLRRSTFIGFRSTSFGPYFAKLPFVLVGRVFIHLWTAVFKIKRPVFIEYLIGSLTLRGILWFIAGRLTGNLTLVLFTAYWRSLIMYLASHQVLQFLAGAERSKFWYFVPPCLYFVVLPLRYLIFWTIYLS